MIFYNIISLISTFTVILVFLHLRINKKILEICLNNDEITRYYNFFLLLFAFSLSIIFYLCILHNLTKNKNTFWIKHKKLWTNLQKYNIFYHAYSIIFDYFSPNYTIYFVKFAKGFVEYSTKDVGILVFVFVVLPRLLIIVLLCIEVFITKTLHYYFYAIILLLIPIFFRLFVFIFKDLSPRLLPEFKKFLDVDTKETMFTDSGSSADKKQTFTAVQFKLKPEYSYMDILDLLHNFYYPLLFLRGHMDVYVLPMYSKFNTYSIFFYYICHALIWGYLLYLATG